MRRPDITRAQQVLGWVPEIDLEEGLRRWLDGARPGAGPRPDARAPGVLAVVVAVRRRRLAATAQPADASRYLRVGIYDEAQTLYGPIRPDLPLLKTLHVQEIRLEPVLGRPVRRGDEAARQREEPERPGVRLGALRPHGRSTRSSTASTSCSRSTGPRVGRSGKARRTLRRRTRPTCATSRMRPPSATAARSPARTGKCCRRSRSGPPGTSRTTRSSSRRSTRRRRPGG